MYKYAKNAYKNVLFWGIMADFDENKVLEEAESIVGDCEGEEVAGKYKYFNVIGERKGKPILQLNEEGVKEVKMLAKQQCEEEEICAYLDTEIGVMKNKYNMRLFNDAVKKGRLMGNVELRRMQWRLANTNSNMAIQLGKNVLHQSDETQLNLKGSGNTVQIEIVGKSIPKKGEKKK